MVKAGLILLAAAAMAFTHPATRRRASSEFRVRTAPGLIDFRSSDRDGGRVQDFWTLDVVGLYAPAEEGQGATAWMRRLMGWFEPPAPRSGWDIID